VRRFSLVFLPAVILAARAVCAHAQEWDEAYEGGLRALAEGDARRAVSLLERAASLRPEPGRDVRTYGTNVEALYHPYIHLTEAYLQIGDLAGARSALARSGKWGREPESDRGGLASRVEELAAKLTPPDLGAPPLSSRAVSASVPDSILMPPMAAIPGRATAAAHAPAASRTPAPSLRAPLETASPAGSPPPTGHVSLHGAPAPPVTTPIERRLVFATVGAVLLGLTPWAMRRSRPSGRRAPERTLGSAPTPTHLPWPQASGRARHGRASGRYFGEYRLLQLIGAGGMASVYKAERGGGVVALKRALPALRQQPEFRERFLREAEIGRTLNHPRIVRVLDRGQVGGVPYFTMELVPGETLQARLRREAPMEPRRAARLVVQVAEALDYAHLKGVVHRDLKPSNVMVLDDGTARVMDFGIARSRRFEGLTVSGAFLGTPEYVAPEAILETGTDARSDLYSLGVMLYETLTGRRPFRGDAPLAILRQHLMTPPASPSAWRPGLPSALDAIVIRLLSKRPEQRHQRAEDLVLELRGFLDGGR
jgi:hypothetical protein